MPASLTVALMAGFLTPDVTRQVILSHAGSTRPIYAALIAMGKERSTQNLEFKWATDRLGGLRTLINGAGLLAATTAIPVDDGTIFAPNTMILFEATGEVGLVTAVATNTLTVVRSVGATAASNASVADNANVRNIGRAAGEGSNAPTANMSAPTSVSNYVQTMRIASKLTGSMIRSTTDTEEERGRQRSKKFEEALDDIEQSILFGAKGTTTDANGDLVRHSAGFVEAITTNVDAVGGAMSKTRLNQFARMAFAKGATEKLLIAGTTVVEAIHTIFENKLNTVSAENVAGLKLTQVNTPYGVFNLVPHRNMLGAYDQQMIAIDLDQVELRYSQAPAAVNDSKAPTTGRLHLRENIQGNDADAQIDEWFGEMGLQYGDEEAHARATGITGGA